MFGFRDGQRQLRTAKDDRIRTLPLEVLDACEKDGTCAAGRWGALGLEAPLGVEDGSLNGVLDGRIRNDCCHLCVLQSNLVKAVFDRGICGQDTYGPCLRRPLPDHFNNGVHDVEDLYLSPLNFHRLAQPIEENRGMGGVAWNTYHRASSQVEPPKHLNHRRNRAGCKLGIGDPRAAIEETARVRNQRNGQVLLIASGYGLIEERPYKIEAGVGAKPAEDANSVSLVGGGGLWGERRRQNRLLMLRGDEKPGKKRRGVWRAAEEPSTRKPQNRPARPDFVECAWEEAVFRWA